MNRIHAAILAVILFFSALLYNAPSHLVAPALDDAGLIAGNYEGTLWRGEIDSLLIPVAGAYVQAGRVQWKLSPWRLLILTVHAQLEAKWGRQHFEASLSISPWGGVQISDLSASGDSRLVKLFAPIDLRGQVQVVGDGFLVEGNQLTKGAGRAVWQGATWLGRRGRQSLGEYVLEFDITGANALRGRVSSLAGPVLTEGSVSLDGPAYTIDLNLRSDEVLTPEFASALRVMAEEGDDGYQIKFASSL